MNSEKKLPSLVFFGTPEFARYCLETLLEAGFPVQGVVTAPDRKAGRGKEVRISAVKSLATAKGLPLLQPTNLKDPEFITKLKSFEADVQIVVAFRMLPKVIWDLPKLGTINLHASLLPNYRGAAPINWVLMEGEPKTGVTTFLINEQIDTGAILQQREIEIAPADDAGILHDKLLRLGAPLIVETLKDISTSDLIPRKQQFKGNEKDAPKLTPENTELDWTAPLERIANQVRGLSPYPGAWSVFENKGKSVRIKIYKAQILPVSHNYTPKKVIIQENQILIAHTQGFLNCLEIQLPNKKRMPAKALLNGYNFAPDACIL